MSRPRRVTHTRLTPAHRAFYPVTQPKLACKPNLPRTALMTLVDARAGMTAYYVAEMTFYLSSTFMLALWEERRRDFWVMMLHHVLSVFLIGASYMTKCAISTPRWHGQQQMCSSPLS